jgi:hypothetical protein
MIFAKCNHQVLAAGKYNLQHAAGELLHPPAPLPLLAAATQPTART